MLLPEDRIDPIPDVCKDFLPVRFHQKLMPSARIEFDLDVLRTGVPEALYGPFDARAPFPYRVGIAGQKEQRELLRHLCEEGGVIQAENTGEHTVIRIQRKDKCAPFIRQILVHLRLVAVEPVVGGAALQPLVVAEEREVRHQFAAVLPAEKVTRALG